ncbi:NAD(P)-dependent alcohol dehydrogenase [Poritiphilus flavus]|uniref:Zinc-binding dehydrogenase n=1 Tax=Poritiphilus flavus TaxID=2697053 RepID=A0A6L9EH48_9FLAO|nr:NAD(P)-dependent alcohol dehydrogenase [Poritiphilus flavus]NAS13976.1 zinc-binding dehydrogenase [Poritiphilus flavus]
MKAILHTRYGPPEVLLLSDLPKPTPGPKELLIRVHKTAVNRTDCAMLRAKPFIMRFLTGLFKPKKPVLGTEFAGEVESVGEEVYSFRPGDRVFGFDDSGLGTYAEYFTVTENKGIAKLPEALAYAQVIGGIEGLHYAYNFVNKVDFKSGERVLINGATGAIGSAMLQLLKAYGAWVTAVGNTRNLELLRKLGADEVIDYQQEDFTKSDRQYDYVFDAVGKSSFFKCKRLLKAKGTYISSELGYMIQNPVLALLTPLTGGKKVRFPIPLQIDKSIELVKALIIEGKYEVVIDKKYSLEEVPQAFKYVETGQKTGNVVIDVVS